MKIWIMKTGWEWHNRDQVERFRAFVRKEDALNALHREFWLEQEAMSEDIDFLEQKDDSTVIMTKYDDCYNSWVEEIEVEE